MISGTEGEIHNVDVVSTYIPIYRENSREVMAVFELYSDVTDTVARIQTVTIRLLFALLAVFFALYLSLLAIVARADRFIQRQYLALADSEAGLKAQKEALEREIKERLQIEEALRRSEEVAASASRAKSEFLSSMSHELRTPMNAILGFTQLLETEPDAPLTESQQRFVRQIMKAGSHLLALIDQVLDLARIEAGRLTLSVEPVSLSAVLDETLPMVQHLAAKTGIAPITVDVDDFRVAADYGRLKQVLLNLLSNAIKYNRSGGSVAVSARASGEQVLIAVADTGKGIPAARLGELFKPFNRLGLESAAIEGTGIGLSVSKQLMEAMGGSIGVESGEGSGSTFWLLLPRAAASRDAAAPAAKSAAVEEPMAIGEISAERVILYVEDNPANVVLMEELVRRFTGVRLVSAHTAELGIAMASHLAPDLIIMDINLPGIDGFEALARLRSNPETERIPVIALSANAMPSAIQRGLAAGFRSYHTKPIQVDAFSRVVSDLLAGEGS
jgi:signal transduction histidine kinase/CheY-like chemotaxis protein